MTYRLYDYLPSGNGYMVRLVLRQLGRPYELVEVDIKTGGWFARIEAQPGYVPITSR